MLKYHREKKNMIQTVLARKMGWTLAKVMQIEDGDFSLETKPMAISAPEAFVLAEVVDWNVDDLVKELVRDTRWEIKRKRRS